MLVIVAALLWAAFVSASTTFTTNRNSYYGVESAAEKLTVAVVPVHRSDVNDHNDVNSTAASDEPVFGELRRITLSATGTDIDFTVIVKDELGITLFSKDDCNTVLLPLSYALSFREDADTNYPGIFVAGPLTVETNDVNAVDLAAINVTLYYEDGS